jgi:Xaa-Pro aminopeptidase
MNEEDGTRTHDLPVAEQLIEFMKSGWSPSPLDGVTASAVVPFCAARRAKLSALYPGVRLVFPSGSTKVRSNDTDYRFRAHTAFSYFTGITGSDALPDSVLVLEPNDNGHEAVLFIHPRSPRDTDEFYKNSKHGEFWVGRRMTETETQVRYGIAVQHIDSIAKFLADGKDSLSIRGQDRSIDKKIEKRKKKTADFASVVSAMRLIKDEFEINEMQKAFDATNRGFADMVRVLPAATSVARGERVVEGAFFGRARLEGNDIGYDSIVASGSHACILHWIKNDGDVLPGDLILIDAGVEMESLYTADITRTLPVNGKFTPQQRTIYDLVYQAQKAGFAAVKPGANFRDFHLAAQRVLAEGLATLGVLPISADESMKAEAGLHRRWTVHGTGHMLGMDVHDCALARTEQYLETTLEPGMILTVEPGIYIHPDDELFPIEYRGIGIRIEDDVLVTETGCRVLSSALPSHPDEVEVWMANLLRR